MKIKSVYIDGLHNAHNKNYFFNDMNYLIGKNGAGKSTVLQAIQFALLGYIPGTNKTKDAILRHSPQHRIMVRVEFDDHTVIEREISDKGSELTVTPASFDLGKIVSSLELPIFNFNEFVGQTANKLKEYFIKNILPTVDNTLDWKTILSDSISDCNFEDTDEIIQYGMSLVPEIDDSHEILDQVINANAKFKEEQSFNKAEIQRLQNTIDSLIYYDDYFGPTDMSEINSELLALNAARDQLIKYNSALETLQSARTELDALEIRLSELGGKDAYDGAIARITDRNTKREQLLTEISSLETKLTEIRASDNTISAVIKSNGICPYTQKNCKSILDKIDSLRSASVTNAANIVEITCAIEDLKSNVAKIDMEIRECNNLIEQFQNKTNRIAALKLALTQIPNKPNTDKDIITLNRDIEVLTENKGKLQANIQYNETIEKITKLKYEAELRGQALAKWVKATDTNGLQTTLMHKPFEELAAKMTGYIQKMYGVTDLKAHFNVTSKANSFSFGLIRDGVYIAYDMLSSGEKCLYTLALMICIVDNNESPLKLLLCDDMFDHLDDKAIENTFIALKQIEDTQFIFAGVQNCENAKDVLVRI